MWIIAFICMVNEIKSEKGNIQWWNDKPREREMNSKENNCGNMKNQWEKKRRTHEPEKEWV